MWLALALTGLVWAGDSGDRLAPSYSAASILNAASNQADAYAPNTFLSIYGTNLAYATRGLGSGDINGGTLPTVLPGTGVRVWVANIPAHIYYVSPTQINILLPTNLVPGPTQLRVQLDSTYGPPIKLTITSVAPALFQLDARMVIAVHANGQLIEADAPAAPGETVVLFATGLGETVPEPGYGAIPTAAATLKDLDSFAILLDGVKVDARRITYAGVAPGFAGLYQINVQLPDEVGNDPEIRIAAGGVSGVAGLHLALRNP
jgi:uncharacterized protein (TIGR03437 family)